MNKRGLEARDLWIAARIEELMDDAEWLKDKEDTLGFERATDYKFMRQCAEKQSAREHAALMADLEDERINAAREY